MNEKTPENAYAESRAGVLVCLAGVLEETQRSLFASDPKRLKQARGAARAELAQALALLDGTAQSKESQALLALAAAAEGLLERMQAGLAVDGPMTETAAAEASEVITLVRDAARDANDMTDAGASPHFRRYLLSNTAVVARKVRELTAGNGKGPAGGAPGPVRPVLFLDLMRLLKGIADDLAAIAQDA